MIATYISMLELLGRGLGACSPRTIFESKCCETALGRQLPLENFLQSSCSYCQVGAWLHLLHIHIMQTINCTVANNTCRSFFVKWGGGNDKCSLKMQSWERDYKWVSSKQKIKPVHLTCSLRQFVVNRLGAQAWLLYREATGSRNF